MTGRLGRRIAAVLGSAVLIAPAGGVAASARAGRAADPVSITVTDISPSTPTASTTLRPLTVSLTVDNRTSSEIKHVRLEAERGDPIETQAALDQALVHASPPSNFVVPIKAKHDITFDLPPNGEQQVTFETTTSILTDNGVCLCHKAAVYPLFFSAHTTGAGNVDQNLGVGSTFLPAFLTKPAPVHVSWVWPLIDQPHRRADGNTFTDDLLASSVGPTGRLSRALSVVEQVGGRYPITLLIDPELLDELEVMATQPYQVSTGNGRPVAGTGKSAAQQWLDRLRTVLTTDTSVQVELTPYADPDVDALTAAGLTWRSTLPADVQAHVVQALAGRAVDTSVAWPAAGVLSSTTLRRLVSDGVGTVLLDSSAVSPRAARGDVPPGLARLSSGGHDVAVGLLSSPLEKYITQAMTLGGAGTAVLPQLLAELAVRAAQEPQTEHVAVLAAPRYVDPSVQNAVRVIADTSKSVFATPMSLGDASRGPLLPTGRSRLAAVPSTATKLPAANVGAAGEAAEDLPALQALIGGTGPNRNAAAQALLAALPVQAQRVTSSAWGRLSTGRGAVAYAAQLTDQLHGLTNGVRIVQPSRTGSYTLASENSPLPITVENDLPYPVSVTVEVRTVNGVTGFKAAPTTASVEDHSKRTLHLATTFGPGGRVRIEAALYAPGPRVFRLGQPVQMTVRTTALGLIGVIITIGAGAVLALALIIRFGRRIAGARRRRRQPPPSHWDPDVAGPPVDSVPTPPAGRSS